MSDITTNTGIRVVGGKGAHIGRNFDYSVWELIVPNSALDATGAGAGNDDVVLQDPWFRFEPDMCIIDAFMSTNEDQLASSAGTVTVNMQMGPVLNTTIPYPHSALARSGFESGTVNVISTHDLKDTDRTRVAFNGTGLGNKAKTGESKFCVSFNIVTGSAAITSDVRFYFGFQVGRIEY